MGRQLQAVRVILGNKAQIVGVIELKPVRRLADYASGKD